ncbi:MAG: hypothetical protein AAF628_11820 [Planctomycetota bacterium]
MLLFFAHGRAFAPALVAGILALSTPAQQDRDEPTRQQLVQRREAKLAKPVFRHAKWHLDYERARADAAESDRLLLVYFTRSYAP